MTTTLHVATTGSDARRVRLQPVPDDRSSGAAGKAQETRSSSRGGVSGVGPAPDCGLSDRRRITYEAAAGEHVVIKGSEQVTGWEPVEGNGMEVSVPNEVFGSFNPYAEEIDGDWIVYPEENSPKKHLGDVYLNGHELL